MAGAPNWAIVSRGVVCLVILRPFPTLVLLSFMKKVLAILNIMVIVQRRYLELSLKGEAVGGEVEDQVIPEQLAMADSLMEGITDAIGKMDVEQVVGEVMQLYIVRRGQEQHQLAYMMEALADLDARIASQNSLCGAGH